MGEEVTTIELHRVRRKCVYLIRCVRSVEHPGFRSAGAVTPHDEHVAGARRPLALDAHQPSRNVEDHVAAGAAVDWCVDVNAELDGGMDDCRLGDGAFLICSEHASTVVVLSDN